MAKVPYSVETLPKISIAWVGCTNVTDRQTDRRQTDGRRHIANMNLSSRSLKTHADQWLTLLTILSVKITSKLLNNMRHRRKQWHIKNAPQGNNKLISSTSHDAQLVPEDKSGSRRKYLGGTKSWRPFLVVALKTQAKTTKSTTPTLQKTLPV